MTFRFRPYRFLEGEGGDGGAAGSGGGAGGDGGGGGDDGSGQKWFESLPGIDDAAKERFGQFEDPSALIAALDAKGEGSENWPEDWRKRMADGLGEDDAKLLDRYTDPKAIAAALIEGRKRISEGFKPEDFPADGTDEQKTAWREKNGIPAEAGAYVENVGDDIVIGEDDSENVKAFAEAAHAMNMPQSQFDGVMKWYMDFQAKNEETLQNQDLEDMAELNDALTEEYGASEYKANKNNIMGVLKANLPAESVDAVLNARLPGGKGLFNDPGFVKGMIQIARLVNPVPALVGSGSDPGKSIDNRLAEIKAHKDKVGYDAWMKDEKLRAEERELLEARDKLKAQAA